MPVNLWTLSFDSGHTKVVDAGSALAAYRFGMFLAESNRDPLTEVSTLDLPAIPAEYKKGDLVGYVTHGFVWDSSMTDLEQVQPIT